MSEWVTQREAAELLGVHPSAVPKMIARGDLQPRPGRRPSISRVEVLELVERRAREAAEVAARVDARTRPRPRAAPQPPDADHTWLLQDAAADRLGCTPAALQHRGTRGLVPFTVHDRRRWYRLDHLEVIVRARAAADRR